MRNLYEPCKSLTSMVEDLSRNPFADLLPDGIIVADEKQRVAYINGRALKMLHATQEDELGKPCFEVLRSEVCEQCPFRHETEKAKANDHFDVDVYTRDGRTLACCMHTTPITDAHGRLLGHVDSFREMGQVRNVLKEQEMLLELYNHEKEKAKRLINSIGDGVFTVGKDLRIRSFNPRIEELTGWSESRVLGQPCSKVLRGQDRCPEQECPILWTLRGGIEVKNHRHPILTTDGDPIPICITTAPVLDQKGELIGAMGIIRDIRELEDLKKKLASRYSYSEMIGKSPKMETIFELIERIADTKTPVLIQGESGTGKELIARAVHFNSTRGKKPFVKINCSALPDPLLESELFGYEKGAFTGATRRKPGKFKMADGGTVFLDEIGDTSPAFQAKLLRVLQDQEFEPLGGTWTEKVDVRILAASNRDLREEVREGRFREDLYYRICVVPIYLPPLRERREDIPLLMHHFLDRIARQYPERHAGKIGISSAATRILIDYAWPGNIRQLENTIERAYLCSESGLLDVTGLPRQVVQQKEMNDLSVPGDERREEDIASIFRHKDPELVLEVLRKYRGNRTLAARALGISRTTLWRRMKEIEQNSLA